MPPASVPAKVWTPVTVGSAAAEPLSSTNVNPVFMLTALVSPSLSVTVTWYSPAPSVWSFGGTKDEAAGKVGGDLRRAVDRELPRA